MGPRPVPDPAVRAHRAPARPDPTRLRFALSVGGLAALSGLVTGIILPPSPAAPSSVGQAPVTTSPGTLAQPRPIRYVQLSPGESPPPGARVIDAKAPKPITIVTLVPAPAQRTVVVRTTQSGKALP
jgi:hypothetical protein